MCACVLRDLCPERFSMQLKTVITVIFTMAGDEAAHPGCDMAVTGVHA